MLADSHRREEGPTTMQISKPIVMPVLAFVLASTLLMAGRDTGRSPDRAVSAENHRQPVRNIVLVHGAWADGSGWKPVYDILVKDGYNVSIVQEPETSFEEDVNA